MKIQFEGQAPFILRDVRNSEIQAFWRPTEKIKVLSGSIKTFDESDHDFLQNLSKKTIVTVEGSDEPYLVRTCAMRSSHSRDNNFVESEFEVALAEKESKPQFSKIEINGEVFEIDGYNLESDNDASIHSFLLSLSDADFSRLNKQFMYDSTTLKRVGVDAGAAKGYIGGGNYWSEEKDRLGHFARILRFVVRKQEAIEQDYPASDIEVKNLDRQVIELSMKVEFLLSKMKNILSEDDLAVLASYERQKEKIDHNKYWNKLDKIKDARVWFERECS